MFRQGSKQRLLEQKIPATYLHLEEVVGDLVVELRGVGRDPVLGQEEFEHLVTGHMKDKYDSGFRDNAELHQATTFLHDNGVLLHYDDATLRDLYFLDPQWLCDMLSHVVTIREINPFIKNGIMQLEDLKHVFKSSAAVSLSAKSYIVNLLNKFEVGLTWDSRTLLIPSLLPTETMLHSGLPGRVVPSKMLHHSSQLCSRNRQQGEHSSEDERKSQRKEVYGEGRGHSCPQSWHAGGQFLILQPRGRCWQW